MKSARNTIRKMSLKGMCGLRQCVSHDACVDDSVRSAGLANYLPACAVRLTKRAAAMCNRAAAPQNWVPGPRTNTRFTRSGHQAAYVTERQDATGTAPAKRNVTWILRWSEGSSVSEGLGKSARPARLGRRPPAES